MKNILKAMLAGASVTALGLAQSYGATITVNGVAVSVPSVLSDNGLALSRKQTDSLNYLASAVAGPLNDQATGTAPSALHWGTDVGLLQLQADGTFKKVGPGNPLATLNAADAGISATRTVTTGASSQSTVISFSSRATALIHIVGLSATGSIDTASLIMADGSQTPAINGALVGSAAQANTFTADGTYRFDVAGAVGIQFLGSAGTSAGSVTYNGTVSTNPSKFTVTINNPASSPVNVASATQGAPTDPAYTGSNTATEIALLKAVLASQATAIPAQPTSNVRIGAIEQYNGASAPFFTYGFGFDATGAPPTKAPLFTAGIDTGGKVRPFLVGTDGTMAAADAIADLALGAPADPAYTGSGNGSVVALLKYLGTLGSSALPAQTATGKDIGGVDQIGQWTFNATQWGGATLGPATAWGTVPTGNVQNANVNVLATIQPTWSPTLTNQNLEIAALGAIGDAAYSGTGNASIDAVLKGIYAQGISPLPAQTTTGKDIGAVEQFGAPWAMNVTQQAGVTLGAPTAPGTLGTGNVATTNSPRSQSFSDAYNVSVASGAAAGSVTHTLPALNPYGKFNATFVDSQTGTYAIQASNDAFATTTYPLFTGNLVAGVPLTVSGTALTFTSYRAVLTNGTTAGTATVVSSFTAN